MKILLLFALFICVIFAEQNQRAKPSPQEIQEMVETIKNTYYNITDNEALLLTKIWMRHIQQNIEEGFVDQPTSEADHRFLKRACPVPPIPSDPGDVRKLHPANIGILAALGDSITAGFGAKDTSIFSLKEYRELSWSIGAKANTLFTLMKYYNPNLAGSSNFVGTDLANAQNGNNGGVSGAVVEDMPGQADWLISRIKANFPNTWNTQWKLITIWIGGNNLCKFSSCTDPNTMTSAANYKAQLKAALDKIAAQLPKTFVNLVAGIDVTELGKYATTMCKIVHNVACPCGTSTNSQVLNSIRERRLEYNVVLEDLTRELNRQYYTDSKKDFGVALQLFLKNTKIGDKSLLSAGDCFHPSDATHGYLATALWNNMITATPQKKQEWKPEDKETPLCATTDTRLIIDLF